MIKVEMWKKYIQWEKSNPLETEEYGQFAKRGLFQLCCCFKHSSMNKIFDPKTFYLELFTKIIMKEDYFIVCSSEFFSFQLFTPTNKLFSVWVTIQTSGTKLLCFFKMLVRCWNRRET